MQKKKHTQKTKTKQNNNNNNKQNKTKQKTTTTSKQTKPNRKQNISETGKQFWKYSLQNYIRKGMKPTPLC